MSKIAFSSTSYGLVPDITGLVLHCRSFGHSCVLVVQLWNPSFSLAQRLPAEVLVVEGWIGQDGVYAAGAEFKQRGYRYVVATGGRSDKRWGHGDWSYADMAERELIRSGVPRDKIIIAPARDTESQRTYQSVVAVWRALRAKGIQPKALNVFTFAAHARRTRLIFAKVYGGGPASGPKNCSQKPPATYMKHY